MSRLAMLVAAAALAAAAIVVAWIHRSSREAFQSDVPYRFTRIPDVLSPQECAILIDTAKPLLARSTVVNRDPAKASVGERTEDPVRTSYQTWLNEDHPRAGRAVRKLLETASGLTGVRRRDLLEAVMVARYEKDQKYEAHHDSCTHGCEAPIYRRATLLVYLNDDFRGGTTTFPKIQHTAVPKRGSGILFYNTDPETGTVIPESFHSGDPVQSGQKFIATVWIKFPPELHGLPA